MILEGRVHRLGDHVDTDVILPGKFLRTTDERALAAACFSGLAEGWSARIAPGDLIVAGENFGCGSSREHAVVAIRATGIAAIVAASFSRIFYRNAINLGLPAIVCPDGVAQAKDGGDARLDLAAGALSLGATTFAVAPLPPELMGILSAGGLVPFMRRRLAGSAYA